MGCTSASYLPLVQPTKKMSHLKRRRQNLRFQIQQYWGGPRVGVPNRVTDCNTANGAAWCSEDFSGNGRKNATGAGGTVKRVGFSVIFDLMMYLDLWLSDAGYFRVQDTGIAAQSSMASIDCPCKVIGHRAKARGAGCKNMPDTHTMI